MKTRENFVLRQVAKTWVVLPVGQSASSFNGMLTLNSSGALLWKTLEQGASRETLVDVLTDNFTVSREVALADVDAFLAKLLDADCIEE